MSSPSTSVKLNTQQVRRAGEHVVVAELHRRGAHHVALSGDSRGTEISASTRDRTRTVSIAVKTKTAGTWQTTIGHGRPRDEDPSDASFWIFVDIGRDPDARPDHFVAPAWWIENSIHDVHTAYLQEHGGQRARSPDSTHHAIPLSRIERWRERWDLLGIFGE